MWVEWKGWAGASSSSLRGLARIIGFLVEAQGAWRGRAERPFAVTAAVATQKVLAGEPGKGLCGQGGFWV